MFNRRVIEYAQSATGLSNVRVLSYENGELKGPDNQIITSSRITGVPVADTLTLRFEGLSVQLPVSLTTVSQSKNIVKTTMPGYEGTIKEYISSGDFAISIKGVIINTDDNIYPTDQVNSLIQLCDTPNPIDVESAFLRQFDIFKMVIESYNFPQQQGWTNTQTFSIDAISDRPIELIIDDV